MEDSVLLQKLRAGEQSAFTVLVQRYGQRVLNTCYKFLLDKEDAEDTSQEVFVEVYQSIRSFRGDSSLSTWVYRIAVTKCLDELKKRKRQKRISSLGQMLHLDDVAHWFTGGSAADKTIHEKDTLKEVMQALNALPDSQRVAFTLSKIDGYTNTEIADIMKTSTVAVESLIYRAKRTVSEELKEILKKNG